MANKFDWKEFRYIVIPLAVILVAFDVFIWFDISLIKVNAIAVLSIVGYGLFKSKF